MRTEDSTCRGKFETKYLAKAIITSVPAPVRKFVYRIPYVESWLKQKFAHLLSTKREEWFEFKTGPRQGMKMKLRLPEENEFFLETHDPQITRLLCDLLFPSQVFLDVGAHIGYYTLLASRLIGSGGKVFAIDPSPDTVNRLREHVMFNGCQNVQVLEVAAASRDEAQQLIEYAASTLNRVEMGKGEIPLPHESWSPRSQRSVAGRTLDSLLEDNQISPPNFVKIDVEGLEVEVVEGMGKMLDEHKPKLLIEFHHGRAVQEIPRLLEKQDYHAYRIDGDGPVPMKTGWSVEDNHLRQGFNVLFLSQSPPLKGQIV